MARGDEIELPHQRRVNFLFERVALGIAERWAPVVCAPVRGRGRSRERTAAGGRLQILQGLADRECLDVALQRGDRFGIVAIRGDRNLRGDLGLERALDLRTLHERGFRSRVGDQVDAGGRNAEALEIGEHRLRAGDAEQRRLQNDEETRRAGDEGARRGGKGLRRVDDDLVEAAHIADELFDDSLVERVHGIVAVGKLDDRDAVGAYRGQRRRIALVVEAANRLEEDGDAAAAGQIAVDECDACRSAHGARELAAERGRSGATLGADEDEDRKRGHCLLNYFANQDYLADVTT